MGQPGKPNGGTPESGTSDTLARIARLISSGDDARDDDPVAPDLDDEPARTHSSSKNAPPAPAELTSGQLLEALPAGMAIFIGTTIVNANSAFALAFGYATVTELKRAGGAGAVFADPLDLIEERTSGAADPSGCQMELNVRSCSGRTFRMPVAIYPVPSDTDLPTRLIVLRPKYGALAAIRDTDPEDANALAENREGVPPEGGGPKKKKKRKTGRKKSERSAASPSDTNEFLAKISHELRTPLNSIIGFAELMKDEQFGAIGNNRYRGYIRDIYDSGIYALSLVNDLLDISKIESGEFELNFVAVDVAEVVSESVHSMEPQAQRRRVLLRTSIEDGLPPVLADRRSIRQIILNLVSNAIKFTMPGGQVIVSILRTEAGGVRIRVRDTGIGMSKGDVAMAMKPFQQVHASSQTQVGTGLGLPLTKALVEANRARFRVRSAEGRGTRVDVTFPCERLAEFR